MLSKDQLHTLMITSKRIIDKPKPKPKSHPWYTEIWFLMLSTDQQPFEVFMRQNKHLPERFSIGIRWKSEDWSVWLRRYNWAHWPHRNILDDTEVTWPHIHIYNEEYISQGMDYDKYAEETDLYTSFQQAQAVFFKDFVVENYLEYFPDLSSLQKWLFY